MALIMALAVFLAWLLFRHAEPLEPQPVIPTPTGTVTVTVTPTTPPPGTGTGSPTNGPSPSLTPTPLPSTGIPTGIPVRGHPGVPGDERF